MSEITLVSQDSTLQSADILNLMENLQSFQEKESIHGEITSIRDAVEELRYDDVCFFRITQLSFDEDYPRREAFENIISTLTSSSFNIVYLLRGTRRGVELYFGVARNGRAGESVLGEVYSANDYGELIESAFEGNFGGSVLHKVRGKELQEQVLTAADRYHNAGVIVGIPSVYTQEKDDHVDFQGMDRLINSMLGQEWQITIVCEPVKREEIMAVRSRVYSFYNYLALFAKQSVQLSSNKGENENRTSNESVSKNENWNQGESSGKQRAITADREISENKGNTKSVGGGKSVTHGSGKTYGTSEGTSQAISFELANKQAQELMQYLDDSFFNRLQKGLTRGMFKTSIQYMAVTPTHAERLKSCLLSLLRGNGTNLAPMHAYALDLEESKNRTMLRLFQNQYMKDSMLFNESLDIMSRPVDDVACAGLCTYLTSDEISLLAGLPQHEVPGLSLREGIGFGLNYDEPSPDAAIRLGCLVQKERQLNIPYQLSRSALNKHIFIAGVTGSGKTTTCHRILTEANVPFLVIEPAKTEYRSLIHSEKIQNIKVFTLGREEVAPFRFNPFELVKGESISSHVDFLKATFTSAFPMEASMPQILEESIYACYEDKGWDINSSVNLKMEDPYAENAAAFPTMSELLVQMRRIVAKKGFGAQLAADYEGSLVSRLSNLTVGSKGSMLNCAKSIDFDYIAEHNVILEIEGLKSPEDKSLMMGFILSRLSVVIREKYQKNHNFRHITLIEEAHRLLSKVEYGDIGAKKASVETFTDLLAEIRKYGEGFIVVDQIPNKLAAEVLKNTNTKIIHRLYAKDDKETVGDTMLMDDKQKKYLSSLGVGNAIIFTENTPKPVHIKVKEVSDTNTTDVQDGEIRRRFERYLNEPGQMAPYKDRMFAVLDTYIAKIRKCIGPKADKENKEARSILLDGVEKIADRMSLTQREVWETLLERNNQKRTKRQSPEELSMMADFFSGEFSEPGFDCACIRTKQIGFIINA